MKVFTDLQEGLLEQYVTKASDIYYGLSSKEVRKLAYQYGKVNSIKMPHNWSANGAAGEDWFSAYLRRHKKLSIKKPEAISQARVSSFNPTNVQKFYNNLQTILNRLKLESGDIWNMDETGITTVQTPDHILIRKGFKQIGRVPSAEKGNLVTAAVAVFASGNSIPPFFIFPCVKFKSYFLNGAPDGSAGAANLSGWMTEVQFLQFSHHFVKYARSTKERPVLLLLDNHDSHLSVEALNYFKETGVSVCSFPPHCSHKLKPLDRSVFGPFKKYTNTACDAWMKMHPGSTMSIYSIPGIVGNSFPLACPPNNIKAGFAKTGIYPLHVNIFGEHDFMPAYTTDRPPTK
nr:MFS-type transporter clz9-like [Hydra vulgaris]